MQTDIARGVAAAVERAGAGRACRPTIAAEGVDKGTAATKASRAGRSRLLVVLVLVVVASAPATAGAVAARAAIGTLAALVLELGSELLVLVSALAPESAEEEADDEAEDDEAADGRAGDDERTGERGELARLASGRSADGARG